MTEEEGIGWFIDYAASVRSSFDIPNGIKKVQYCRSYIHNEGKILHLGTELDILGLADECTTTLRIVFGIAGK